MDADVYKVVFSGNVSNGTSEETTKKKLAQLFKKDITWSERLFTGQLITIKSTEDLKEAIKYVRILKQCGAESEIIRQTSGRDNSQGSKIKTQNEPISKIQRIHNAFTGDIETLKPKLSYRISIVLVAIGMLILLFLYISLAIATGYGTYIFATSSDVVQSLRHASWIGPVGYFGLIAGGIITVLCMLKPIFSSMGGEPPRFPLNQMQQKHLFELVDQIAEKVGAPAPAQIVVDGDLNASASLIGGGIFKRELRLTIGLPLVMVMNANQLTGVIAHELGHFSQTAGMGLNQIVWRINHWFYISATGQDPWDHKLLQWLEYARQRGLSEQGFINNIIAIILLIIQACLWVSREIIAVFWKIGKLISASISRQMEFDADRYETYLVGSQIFKETSLHMATSIIAYNKAYDALSYALKSDNQLVDDFPMLTQVMVEHMSPKEVEKSHKDELSIKTGIFDSHPCSKERIERAKNENKNGIFSLNHRSTWFFEGFDALSKKYTLWHYRNILGVRVERSQLIEAKELFKKYQQSTEEWTAMREHALAKLPDFFSIPIPNTLFQQKTDSVPTVEQIKAQIKQNSEKLQQLESRSKLAIKRFEKSEQRLFDLKYALFLTQAGIQVDAKSYRIRNNEENTIYQTIEKVEFELKEIKDELTLIADAHAHDLLLITQLLHSAKKNQGNIDEWNLLLKTLSILEKRKLDIATMWGDQQLLSSISQDFDDESYVATLSNKADQLYRENGRRLQRIFQQFGQEVFPFEYGGQAKRTLADYIFPSFPSFSDSEGIWELMHNVPYNFFTLRGRILARVLQIKLETTTMQQTR